MGGHRLIVQVGEDTEVDLDRELQKLRDTASARCSRSASINPAFAHSPPPYSSFIMAQDPRVLLQKVCPSPRL